MLVLSLLATPLVSSAGVFLSINIAPPPLPVYAQPVIPGPGYIWTPGYWSYGDLGYFWVPGTWVLAPYAGALWTPGYWGWGGGFYVFHAGYWGPHIGFYGGINYGFGYTGIGYAGGYWRGGVFNYNRTVNNISNTTNITNVYNRTVVNNSVTNNQVSYNGGTGGVMARPSPQELIASRDRHVQPTAAQQQHLQGASNNRAMLASVNRGSPAVAATPTPGAFNASGVMRANAASPAAQAATTRAMQAKVVTAPATAHAAANASRPLASTGYYRSNAASAPGTAAGHQASSSVRSATAANVPRRAQVQAPHASGQVQRDRTPAMQQHMSAPAQRNVAPMSQPHRNAPARSQPQAGGHGGNEAHRQ
ncbi:YXWGXW repeat-containing protein [Dokdonella soli]|uniref:YXWGXW repeat-containing protein n=2 Tax=Dokdonella soli TaxID=529810 RepID=A0ABP3TY79_9GAMM